MSHSTGHPHRPSLVSRLGGPRLALIVAFAYAVAALASWELFRTIAVSSFYPPAGISLGTLLLTPRRRWGWVLAAVALTELGVDLWQGQPAPAAAGFAVAATMQPLVGATVLRWLQPGRLRLTRRGDAARFLGCCAGAGPLAGAVVGSSTMVWFLERPWWDSFGPYWAGDALAIVTLGAAITALGHGRRMYGRDVAVAALVLALTAVLSLVGFWSALPLVYLPLPVMIAAAFTGRVATVTAAGFVMVVVANVIGGRGRGPWAASLESPGPEAAVLLVYLAGAALTAWVLTIEIAERDQAQQTTRQEIAARRRLQALQDVTAALATAATTEQIGKVMVDHAIGLVADNGFVAVRDDRAGCWRTQASANVPAEIARQVATVSLDAAADLPVTQAAASGRAVVLASGWEIAARFPRAAAGHRQTGTQSLLAVPVYVGNRSRAALAFGFVHAGRFDPGITSIAVTLAELAGQALERAELYEAEHQAAHQLQRALLPKIGSDLPGVQVAVSYRPAQTGHDVGGDWYDVFELPGNKVGIAVGDVVGHDLRAATAMGQLQTLLRSVATTGATPAQTLEALDDACARIEDADCATVGYAEYSPSERLLRYACAGHPPPLLVDDHRATYLEEGRSPPLGIPLGPRPQAEIEVPDGAFLVWYSDGLIENRAEDLHVGLGRLAALASRLPGSDAQLWTQTLLAEMTGGRPVQDDIVVACLQLRGPLSLVGDSVVLRRTLYDTSELVAVRKLLRAWAGAQHVSAAQTDALLIICTEALTNALEHAVTPGEYRPVELTVVRADHGQVRLEVSDHGRWRPHARGDEEHGRGLTMISELSRRTTLELREDGTRIIAVVPVT